MTKIVITNPYTPVNDIRSEDDVHIYTSKLMNLSRQDFLIEFNNVLAAGHNVMTIPASMVDFEDNQELISALNDKVFIICTLVFGGEKITTFDGGNLRSFFSLVQNIDNDLAKMNLGSDTHGARVLTKLQEYL